MPDWLHRTTKQYIGSDAEADLPEPVANYIEYPDLSSVKGYPKKYWAITGDVISLISQTARDTLDATQLESDRDRAANKLNNNENLLRAIMLVVTEEFNILRAEHGLPARTLPQLKTAIRNKLGN